MLAHLDLDIPAGQRVLVTGPSGAGKSTLLRALAGLLLTADDGERDGDVLVDGIEVDRCPQRPTMLFQNPGAAIVADTVGRDVAFGLENAGVAPDHIWRRATEALQTAGFRYPPDHPTSALSGGETQRLALAGALAVGSRVLLLDEPMSMLDGPSARSVVAAIAQHLDAYRPTTVVVDHQVEPWLDLMDRLVVLDETGTVVADGEPHRVLDERSTFLLGHGVWVPGQPDPTPCGVPEDLVRPASLPTAQDLIRAEAVGLVLRNRLTRRGSPPTVALRAVDAVLRRGAGVAITGPSGAGKSSLVRVLGGLQRPTTGRVRATQELATDRGTEPHRWRSRDLARRFAWVPQLPEQGVVATTVRDEVLATARATRRNLEESERRADGLIDLVGLSGLSAASPYHLSGGEQRRLMVAAALASGPSVLLSDEPTIGQDRLTWAAVVGAFAAARAAGVGIAIATHDERAASLLGDERILLEHGARVA